jgi:hypothetical protein
MAHALLDIMHGDSKALLQPIAAPSTDEPLTDAEPAAAALSETSAADAGTWSDELGTSYHSVRWFPGTADIGDFGTYNGGRRGTLRVTNKAMMFEANSRVGAQSDLRISFDEIASIEYRSRRFTGSMIAYAYSAVVTRKSGEVDSFAVVKLIFPVAADTRALAEVLRSKLGEQGTAAASTMNGREK